MPHPADPAILDLAHRQHLVVTRAQALGAGLSSRQVDHRVTTGLWARVAPGVFAVAGAPPSLRRDLMAACLHLAAGAVASHEAAAELHDLRPVPRHRVVVTVAPLACHRCPLARVHRSADLRAVDRTTVDGIPVTTVARTLVDLGAVLRAARLERAVDEALAARRVTLADLDDVFEAVARRGRPGVAAIRRVLAERAPGYVAPESELEARLLAVLAAGGLPEPVRQPRLPWLPRADGRVDLAWPEARLVVEADGRRWHLRDTAFEADRARDNAAALTRWRVLRFTWQVVTRRPEVVQAQVATALAAVAA